MACGETGLRHSTLWVFFPADELPIKEFPGAYVVNTDESNQPGQHWVAFFTINDTIECFDSFGSNPGEYSVHIARWLEDTYQVVQCETLQSHDSTADNIVYSFL